MNIRDAVHGQMEFSDLERELIDLPQMQRLRQIKQVGLTYLVYPCAHHTRFEHSLGTAHLASKMGERLHLSKDEITQLRLAALLHDVGHMPFSHDSEEILEPHTGNHEKIGEKRINSGEIKEILEKNYSAKKISDLAFGKNYGQLISSDVGADRLDYLLRDAHFTGVAYGVIDWGRILAKILFKSNELQIEKGGLEAAESIILARFSMFHTVYYHHAVRVARKMLQKALQIAIDEKKIDTKTIPNEGDNSLLILLSKIPSCSDYISRINERRLYKRAATFYWNKLSSDKKKYVSSGEFESDLQQKFPMAMVDLPSQFKSQADVRINDGKTSPKLSEISSISSSLEAAAGERATLLVISPDEEREKIGSFVSKLL